MPLLLDLEPLRSNPDYRRLYAGFTLSNIGSQLAVVAIGLQVYDLTRSTASVGIVGLCALVPLVVMGLYGGTLVDHFDRRVVGLVAQAVAFAVSVLCALQAWLGNTEVWVLYALVAAWNAAFAVSSPARTSIYPRILRREQLPAANALSVFAMNASMTVGPLLAGLLVDWGGFKTAYTVDAVITTAALWGLARLPSLPTEPVDGALDGDDAGSRVATRRRAPGIRSVLDGFAFLATRPNVRMTFVADIAAMVLAQPRVLFPAAGAVIFGGGATTVGALSAAAAVGGIGAMFFSGRLGTVIHQGRAIMISIVGWGAAIAGFGAAMLAAGGVLTRGQALWVGLAAMAVAGASDSVSAVFRTTILQSATPDHLRGRLQGVFIVVVAGGPRLGELLGGFVAEGVGEGWTAVAGGLACVAAILVLARAQPGFLRYDARTPTP
ncbi:putative MFS family arabinose efflux permease [Knoellia remsis]|uniref:Putative MFS family arabinose efflux permease n=1 Tax=Knoellia remsis TaxID=407159 RepID=A0A2T0UN85_9MICO|nr:MFS transporter [Knoellia remsis]PRY59356.1 putative MFS family arabinose efflux permease [Knoellia remsis]